MKSCTAPTFKVVVNWRNPTVDTRDAEGKALSSGSNNLSLIKESYKMAASLQPIQSPAHQKLQRSRLCSCFHVFHEQNQQTMRQTTDYVWKPLNQARSIPIIPHRSEKWRYTRSNPLQYLCIDTLHGTCEIYSAVGRQSKSESSNYLHIRWFSSKDPTPVVHQSQEQSQPVTIDFGSKPPLKCERQSPTVW